MVVKDLTGKRFGRLLAIHPTDKRIRKAVVWLCQCDCGKQKEVTSVYLNAGYTRSCGCLRIDILNSSYNGDCDSNSNRKRTSGKDYGNWRVAVYNRDDYTCKMCDRKRKYLNAHHLNSWDSNEEERLNVDNGITLCVMCHKSFHAIYGRGGNTKDQFEEFKKTFQIDFDNDGYEDYEKKLNVKKEKSKKIVNKRKLKRLTQKRRAAGVPTRVEYDERRITEKLIKMEKLKELKATNPNAKQQEIIETLGISRATINRYMKEMSYGV